MRALVKLFGRSPFAPLRAHMEKVASCVHHVLNLFTACAKGDQAEVEEIATLISKLEHEADLTKNDIRRSLKSHLFLPVDRASLLEILSLQDSLADLAEDIGVLLTLRKMRLPTPWAEPFDSFLHKNIESFNGAYGIVAELHELLESSFGGLEAEKIRGMVDKVAYAEHEADLLQRSLLRLLFNMEPTLPQTEFFLWLRIFETVGELSNRSEKLSNRIVMMMET